MMINSRNVFFNNNHVSRYSYCREGGIGVVPAAGEGFREEIRF